MIVQLRIDDIDVRHSLEGEFGGALNAIADVTGGDIGSGTANIFILVSQPHWDAVLTIVQDVLAKRGLLDEAVIAREDREQEETITVVWPPDHAGEFTYW